MSISRELVMGSTLLFALFMIGVVTRLQGIQLEFASPEGVAFTATGIFAAYLFTIGLFDAFEVRVEKV